MEKSVATGSEGTSAAAAVLRADPMRRCRREATPAPAPVKDAPPPSGASPRVVVAGSTAGSARELELEFPDGGSGPRLRRLSLCCAASGGPRWCSQAGEREAKLGHSFPRASSGELRSEERGEAFLRCLWAGSQTVSWEWVTRWSRYTIGKGTVQDFFLGLGSIVGVHI